MGGESVLDAAYAIQPMSDPAPSHQAPPAQGNGYKAARPSGAAEPAPTYEAACARIEEIIKRLDSGEAGLRETLELCQEGRRLVEFCASELEAVGRGLEELRLDELVARLEAGRAAAPA
jgi:exodeoxyribonuclease VII small subunit